MKLSEFQFFERCWLALVSINIACAMLITVRIRARKTCFVRFNILSFLAILFIVLGNIFFVSGANAYSYSSYDCSQYWYLATPTLDWKCTCMSWYGWGKDYFGKDTCKSLSSLCTDKFGYGASYDSLSGSCGCSDGYKFGSDYLGKTQCVPASCWAFWKFNDETKTCECRDGYVWSKNAVGSSEGCNSVGDLCKDQYGYWAKALLDWKCGCSDGYKFKKDYSWDLKCSLASCPIYSVFNDASKTCECSEGYTMDGWECRKKALAYYAILTEGTSSDAIVYTEYEGVWKYYKIKYYSCYSAKDYVGQQVVLNTMYDNILNYWDYLVLPDKTSCTLNSVELVNETYTLKTCGQRFWANTSPSRLDSNKCECNSWYYFDATSNSCLKKYSEQEVCILAFWANSVSVGGGNCGCQIGYDWAQDKKSCTLQTNGSKLKKIIKKCKVWYQLKDGLCLKRK